MTYQEAQDLAVEFGAKKCSYRPGSEVAQCWIDRIEGLQLAASQGAWDLAGAIAEANRYA